MKKSNKKMGALKDMMGRAMAARAGRGAMAAPAAPMGMGMKKGGSFRTSANGIAVKGKTKGKQIKMARGGMKGC
jgi:hypothetical protein